MCRLNYAKMIPKEIVKEKYALILLLQEMALWKREEASLIKRWCQTRRLTSHNPSTLLSLFYGQLDPLLFTFKDTRMKTMVIYNHCYIECKYFSLNIIQSVQRIRSLFLKLSEQWAIQKSFMINMLMMSSQSSSSTHSFRHCTYINFFRVVEYWEYIFWRCLFIYLVGLHCGFSSHHVWSFGMLLLY